MAIHCVAAEHGGLIKKKEIKKESLWVKLNAFPTNGHALLDCAEIRYAGGALRNIRAGY